MIGARLTMRAQVMRNQAAGKDGWSQDVAPDFQPVGDPLPCFVWSPKATEAVDTDRSAQLLEMRGMFAIGVDLRAHDELDSVTDRRTGQLVAGRLRMLGPPQFKHNHLEAAFERVS